MARDAFVKDRKTYAPVLAGDDVVEWLENQQRVPGKRKHGVSFEQHIWLFSNEENLARFAKNWEHYERLLENVPAK
jgi:hypothetical protein